MSNKQKPTTLREYLPVYCRHCKGEYVEVIREPERILLRCATCGRKIFTHYDAVKDQIESGEFPRMKIHRIENDLLEDLGPRSRAVYVYLRGYFARNGYAPTMREIQDALGLRSLNSIAYHLKRLEGVDLIRREWGVARGIHLLYARE